MKVLKTFTRTELESLYRDNSNEVAAKEMGVSIPTMLKILKDNNIEAKGQGGHNHDVKVKVVD